MDRYKSSLDYPLNKERLIINYPLVDDNFNVLDEAKSFIDFTKDELVKKDVLIIVDSISMVSTAVFLSMRKRINVNLILEVHKFKGYNFVESFLRSAHVKDVIIK